MIVEEFACAQRDGVVPVEFPTSLSSRTSQQRGSAARIIPSACVEKAIPATTQS